MSQFRKKPVVIEATQWWKNGDHPDDFPAKEGPYDENREGEIVRRHQHPDVRDDRLCDQCSVVMRLHGWIDTIEGGHIVCPGDWIITGIKGELYPCKADIFNAIYEKVDE